MLSTIERALFLKSADVFGAVAVEDLIPVARVAEEVAFEAGERFIRRGEAGSCLFVLLDGEASVEVPEQGQIAVRSRGSVLGEMAILTDQPRTADCIALTEVSALKLEHDDFWELMAERPELALGVIKVLTENLGRMLDRDASGAVQDALKPERP